MIAFVENWYEVRPELPALPSWWVSDYGIPPVYSWTGAPQGSGWTAVFDSSTGGNPSFAWRTPFVSDRLASASVYLQFVLYPPTSGDTYFSVGPYTGTRCCFFAIGSDWYVAGPFSGSAKIQSGTDPICVEVAYIPSSVPASGTSGSVTWQCWLRVNGALICNGSTRTISEYNDPTYGLRVPYFRADSEASSAWHVSSVSGYYGVTAADANALFHPTTTWTPIHPGEAVSSESTGMWAARIGGSGTRQVSLAPGLSGIAIPDAVQTHKGVRIRGAFRGCNVPAYPSGASLFTYVEINDASAGGTYVAPDSGTDTLSSPSLPLNARYSGVFDISITAETFEPSPDLCVPDISGSLTITVEGGGTYDLPYTYYGAGRPVASWEDFISAWVQLYVGSTGSESHIFQMDSVVVSEWSTIAPPHPPTIYPPSGNYTGTQYAGIVAPVGFPRFTTDGSDPTGTSEIFTRGIKITDGMVLKAVTDFEGVVSAVTTVTYQHARAIPTPIPSYRESVLPLLLEQYKGDNP